MEPAKKEHTSSIVVHARCGHGLQRGRCGLSGGDGDTGSGFYVGAVAAGFAYGDGILADGGKQHKLMADIAAHHAGIGCYRNHLRQPDPLKNAVVAFRHAS